MQSIYPVKTNGETVCIVAILRDENPFLDEWLVYHRMIGIEHFFLYDDDEQHRLKHFLSPHSSYITVIDWNRQGEDTPEFNNQRSAFKDAVDKYVKKFEWVVFLDCDEFVTLRENICVQEFLSGYKNANAVSLRWYFYGHNGYYDDPKTLITSSLTRRKRSPSRKVKTFTRTVFIKDIDTSHYPEISQGKRVTNNERHNIGQPDETRTAYIAHYHCRSFKRWMKRAERGDSFYNKYSCSEENEWRLSYEGCLRQFVTVVALDHNEQIDTHMVKYNGILTKRIENIRNPTFHKLNLSDSGLRAKLLIQLEMIANILMLKSELIEEKGLLDGKVGIAVFLYHYSEFTLSSKYKNHGIQLINDVLENTTSDISFNYSKGLIGIGLAIEYLTYYGYMDEDTDEFLNDIELLLENSINKYVENGDNPNGIGLVEAGYFLVKRITNRRRLYEKDFITEEEQKLLSYLLNAIDFPAALLNNPLMLMDFLTLAFCCSVNKEQVEDIRKLLIELIDKKNKIGNILHKKPLIYNRLSLFLHNRFFITDEDKTRLKYKSNNYLKKMNAHGSVTASYRSKLAWDNILLKMDKEFIPDYSEKSLLLAIKKSNIFIDKCMTNISFNGDDLGAKNGLAGLGICILNILNHQHNIWSELFYFD